MLGLEFVVMFPSWFTSLVFLTFDCLLRVTCVSCCVGDLWRVNAVVGCGLDEIVCVMGD